MAGRDTGFAGLSGFDSSRRFGPGSRGDHSKDLRRVGTHQTHHRRGRSPSRSNMPRHRATRRQTGQPTHLHSKSWLRGTTWENAGSNRTRRDRDSSSLLKTASGTTLPALRPVKCAPRAVDSFILGGYEKILSVWRPCFTRNYRTEAWYGRLHHRESSFLSCHRSRSSQSARPSTSPVGHPRIGVLRHHVRREELRGDRAMGPRPRHRADAPARLTRKPPKIGGIRKVLIALNLKAFEEALTRWAETLLDRPIPTELSPPRRSPWTASRLVAALTAWRRRCICSLCWLTNRG